jgi:alkaline phosphatase D
MSALRAPGLGPIIGHTTHDSCRLWIQAGDPEDKGGASLSSNRRTIGVIALLEGPKDNPKVKKDHGYYFRLHREFDRTGTFCMGQDVTLGRHESDGVAKPDKPAVLKPDTSYRVRMGTLSIDDPLPDAESMSDVILAERLPPIQNIAPMLLELTAEESEVEFRTFPDGKKTQDSLSFLLGSCRYPGLLWKVKEADLIFGPMLDHFKGRTKDAARFTLMAGDQIYADTLNRFVPVGLADTYEEFQERYRKAFISPNMRQLLRTAPTYMLLDDHEIEDNWTQDRIKTDAKHRLFNLAIGAYMSYQWSHGPRTFGRRLFYTFECGGYPFFALDTRTQRFKDDNAGLADNHLLGRHPSIDLHHPGQLQILLDWLKRQQDERGNVPKFIASSSVFAPNAMDERLAEAVKDEQALFLCKNKDRLEASDSWPAFPSTRRALLDHIVKHKIENVVFLTGDIHCANIARLTLALDGKDTGLHAYDVTSSAFYWPFPFADGDPNNYVHDSRDPRQLDAFPIAGGEMHYTAWGFTQLDNFCRIDVDKDKEALRVRYYDRKGENMDVTDAGGNLTKVNTLPLAAWK